MTPDRSLKTGTTLVQLVAAALLLVGVFSQVACRSQEAGPDLTDEVKKAIKAGTPLVQAMYTYRARTGLWPAALTDLEAEGIDPRRFPGWIYLWNHEGMWDLQAYVKLDLRVQCSFRNGRWCWLSYDGDTELVQVRLPGPAAHLGPSSPKRARAREKELLRRITAWPREPLHSKGLVAHYWHTREWDKAERACRAHQRQWPSDWWPAITLAYLAAAQGDPVRGERIAWAWLQKDRTFPSAVLFAAYQRDVGNVEGCLATIRAGLHYRVVELEIPGTHYAIRPDSFFWDAAWLAYGERRFDLARRVCDRWERQDKDPVASDKSFLSIRSACHLAEKDFHRAAEDLARAKTFWRRTPFWGDDIGELERAVARRNPSFRFEPGWQPAEQLLAIIIRYE